MVIHPVVPLDQLGISIKCPVEPALPPRYIRNAPHDGNHGILLHNRLTNTGGVHIGHRRTGHTGTVLSIIAARSDLHALSRPSCPTFPRPH